MLSVFSLIFYIIFLSLFAVFSYKGYKRLSGFFLIIIFVKAMFMFKLISGATHWWPIIFAQCLILVIGSFGLQLRYAGKRAWNLYFKTFFSSSNDLSDEEILTIFKFHINLKKAFWKFTLFLCLTTFCVNLCDVLGRLYSIELLRVTAFKALYPLVSPVFITIFITHFLFAFIHSNIQNSIPLDHFLREDDFGTPRWIWLMPILVLFIILSPNLYTFLGEIPIYMHGIVTGNMPF